MRSYSSERNYKSSFSVAATSIVVDAVVVGVVVQLLLKVLLLLSDLV